VFGVSNAVANHVLEEHLQDAAGFFVDQSGDPLDAATTGQPSDRRLGNALDVIAEDLAVTLRAALA